MDIPAELHQRLRIVCVLEGKTMKQIAQKLLEDYVEKAEKRKLIVLPKVKHPKEAS